VAERATAGLEVAALKAAAAEQEAGVLEAESRAVAAAAAEVLAFVAAHPGRVADTLASAE
jgi:hypothetical protein